MQKPTKPSAQGIASVMVLIIGLTTAMILGGLVVLSGVNYSSSKRQVALERALGVAEAGAHYYRWHLAHAPDDYTDGTGEPGPYVHDYRDPEGGVVGQFSLEIIPPEQGYTNTTIVSTGWTSEFPNIKRTVRVQYGIPSLARYSFLHNANVWFGQGLTVHGRVLSNGGIRQDGINDSIIQSAKETYTCGSETGCSPSQTRDGVWGAGGPSDLWEYPVPPEDFDGISIGFAAMQTAAAGMGTYYEHDDGDEGFHVVFLADGRVQIYDVTVTQRYRGYDNGTCFSLYQRIDSENLIATHNLADKNVFFFEDTVWVEGVVNGKATVVAARFPIDTYTEDMWINGNVTYLAKDGNHQLGLIAQRNIYFAKDLPDDFEINAALLAQQGKIIRHHYGLPWYYFCGGYSNAVRDHLDIYGSVISGQKSYWNWGNGPDSGFETRDVVYDADLYLQPPPYFPTSGGDYEVISWEEDLHN